MWGYFHTLIILAMSIQIGVLFTTYRVFGGTPELDVHASIALSLSPCTDPRFGNSDNAEADGSDANV